MTSADRAGRLARVSRGLTDDVLTLVPRARSLRVYLRSGADQLVAADPGLTQLRQALQAVLGIAGGVGLAFVFVQVTGALQLPAGTAPPAVEHTADHALLIVAMLISAMVAMMAGFTVNDPTARGQILSSLWLPIPMLAAMTIGIALGPYRVVSLIWLVVLLSACVYVRRFGPRGVASGLVMFNGGFLGFFLHAEIGLRDVGWLAALLGLGILASLIVRFTLFRPDLLATLARMRRSWTGRAHRVLAATLALLEAEDSEDRAARSERLQRHLVRLNECTLMVDAQLVEAIPDTADVEAQRLFDSDLALSNMVRFASVLAERSSDDKLLKPARGCIAGALREDAAKVARHVDELRDATGDDERMTVVAHRLGGSAAAYMAARGELSAEITARVESFTPAVALTSGWLPGSGPVSTEASTTPGRGGALDRTALPPYLRATIQVAVAATIAIVIGNAVSSQRLYWAVLATFLAFMATTNSGEQVRKALFRVAGTAIGIVVGDLLVHLTGGHVWSSLLIVIVALFFGIYLIRVNYTFMVIGITVTLSQLYAQLGEFSWHLLVLRLLETAIGVGAVVLTVLVVVPLRPQRVLTSGVLLWFRSLTVLLDHALDDMLDKSPSPSPSPSPATSPSSTPASESAESGSESGSSAEIEPSPPGTVRSEIRDLDAAYAALEATAAPLRRTTFGRNSTQLTEIRAVSSAARHYVRTFSIGVQDGGCGDSPQLALAADQMRRSSAAIENRIATGAHGTYTRSASLVEMGRAAAPPERQAALRDLTLLDGTLARLATALGMAVADYDTVNSAAGS